MSLDIYFIDPTPTYFSQVHWQNITHNLNLMADAAGFYEHIWHPDLVGVKTANDLIEPLIKGLEDMKKRPDYFKQFGARNGWGTYDQFIPWLEELLSKCKEYPEAIIEVSI